MHVYADAHSSAMEGYKAPMCFELAGKHFEFTLDSGEPLAMSFAAFPIREVYVGGAARGLSYDCAKIGPQVFYFSYVLPEACAGYVLDIEKGLITRVITDRAGQSAFAFGGAGAEGGRHAFTGEMKGAAFRWTIGREAATIFVISYEEGGVSITRPNAVDAPALRVSDFRAVRVNENIILQTAAVQVDGAVYYVNFVSNFWNITCVGSVYSAQAARGAEYRLFAGHGRYATDDGLDSTGEYKLSPFAGIGIRQFTPPYSFELAGESFELVMDDGYDYALRFLDGKTLEWNWVGSRPKQEKYLCLKGDDTTYLVSFELQGASPRANHTFVIDRENSLVTRLISKVGTNPKYPYLMKTEYEFGAIRRGGAEVPLYPRHGFSDDVMGNLVEWTYTSEGASLHVYYCANSYRISYSRDPVYHAMAERMSAMLNSAEKKLPSTDEPCTYIKIKEGLYLYTLTEANGEKILGAEMGGFRSNTMSFLHNFKTMRTFGRSFGTSTPPEGGEIHRHLMYTAYGKLIDPEIDESLKKMLTDPNPFIAGG